MKPLASLALKEAVERVTAVSQQSYQVKYAVESVYNHYQAEIRAISAMISLINSDKDDPKTKVNLLEMLNELMTGTQNNMTELRKAKEAINLSDNEIPKIKQWINAVIEE